MSLSKSLAGALSRGSSNFEWHSMQELFFWAETRVKNIKMITPEKPIQDNRRAIGDANCICRPATHVNTYRSVFSRRSISINRSRHISDYCHHHDVEKRH